jgi:hypothetical protein
MAYYKLHMRLTRFLQRFSRCFRMEHIILNKSGRGNVNNKMTDSTIVESFFSQTTLHYVSISYSNTMTSQNQATAVKLRALKLFPKNLTGLEYARI